MPRCPSPPSFETTSSQDIPRHHPPHHVPRCDQVKSPHHHRWGAAPSASKLPGRRRRGTAAAAGGVDSTVCAPCLPVVRDQGHRGIEKWRQSGKGGMDWTAGQVRAPPWCEQAVFSRQTRIGAPPNLADAGRSDPKLTQGAGDADLPPVGSPGVRSLSWLPP